MKKLPNGFDHCIIETDDYVVNYSKRKIRKVLRSSIETEFKYESPAITEEDIKNLTKQYLKSLMSIVRNDPYYSYGAPKFIS